MLMTGGVPSAGPFHTECKNVGCCNVNVAVDCKEPWRVSRRDKRCTGGSMT